MSGWGGGENGSGKGGGNCKEKRVIGQANK